MKKKIPKVFEKESVRSELKFEVSQKFILHTIRGYISKQYIHVYKTQLILKLYMYVYV